MDIADHAGRLAPIAALVEAIQTGAAHLDQRLVRLFPSLAASVEYVAQGREFHGHPSPAGLGGSGVAVWHETAVFAVSSVRPPMLSIDGADPLPMTAIPGTPRWFRLATIEPGLLRTFRYRVADEWGPSSDVAGYTPSSYENPDVRAGVLSEKRVVHSEVYPGATTDYWLYVNDGIDEKRGAPVMIWHDGASLTEPADLVGLRMQIVTDNLAHQGRIPPMVHVLVCPSTGGEAASFRVGEPYTRSMRSLQYDTVSDRYGHHVVDEILPDVEQSVKLRSDAYSRGSAGISSGGICAFNLAWFQPEQFSRVYSAVGSFTGLQWRPEDDLIGGFMVPHFVRREPQRNIRVWLSDGMNDLELAGQAGQEVFVSGSWPLNNIMLANALKGMGYDFHFRFGQGYHTASQAALELPESLAWLWRGYDPGRTEQSFEQEAVERSKPVFRVQIANRDAL